MKFLRSFFRRRDGANRTDISQRFDLIGRLGNGSMSKVWRALDKSIGRVVALKILDMEKTLRYESRFSDRVKPTEGEIACQLLHPNIVHTLEHGRTTRNEQYLVMDLIDGIGLAYLVDVQNDVMQAHRLRLMIELGEAVEYLHKQNWIHRDICPRNVLVTKENSTRLIDFGLVVPNTAAFQEPGNRTGTANYMAPELIKRQRTDQRIDIFSFAVTCYEMYCRQLPWPAITTASLEAVLKRINQRPTEIQDVVQLDPQIGSTIMKGLELDPRERWQTMTEMVKELRSAYERLTPTAKKQAAEAASKKRPKRRDDFAGKWQFKTE
jgi:eukaryotic-like serine/threonine-protein kinase